MKKKRAKRSVENEEPEPDEREEEESESEEDGGEDTIPMQGPKGTSQVGVTIAGETLIIKCDKLGRADVPRRAAYLMREHGFKDVVEEGK